MFGVGQVEITSLPRFGEIYFLSLSLPPFFSFFIFMLLVTVRLHVSKVSFLGSMEKP
jgi:hypothetical protein